MSTLIRIFRQTLFFLTATIGTAHADQAALSGDWFTEGTEDGKFVQSIIHRDASGAYSIKFRELVQCKPINNWIESGVWSLVGDKIDQNTKIVGGHPAQYHDEYYIKSASADSYTMLDPATHVTWQWLKVPSDFTFPDPKSCAIS
jgi:hypothetical protein